MKKTIAILVAIFIGVLTLFARLDYSQTSGQLAVPMMGPAPLNAEQRMARDPAEPGSDWWMCHRRLRDYGYRIRA